MAKPHQKVLALVLALVFLASSLAAGLGVIWQINQDNSKDPSVQGTTTEASQPKEAQLQGTKLADFTPAGTVAKLQIIDTKVGTGEEVKPHATVTAHYTGALVSNGTIFQSSKDMGEPIEFSLDGVIKGWGEGVPGMKVGGIRRLVIPAAQAYGAESPSPDIPANSDLVFDIELTAVKNP